MVIALAVVGNRRQAEQTGARQRLKAALIEVINLAPPPRDGVHLFQLRVEEGADDFAGRRRATHINPCVLVDFPAQELFAVGALVADDLGALDQLGRIDRQRAAFAAVIVLGVMKAISAEVADGSQRFAAIESVDALRGVFDHQ